MGTMPRMQVGFLGLATVAFLSGCNCWGDKGCNCWGNNSKAPPPVVRNQGVPTSPPNYAAGTSANVPSAAMNRTPVNSATSADFSGNNSSVTTATRVTRPMSTNSAAGSPLPATGGQAASGAPEMTGPPPANLNRVTPAGGATGSPPMVDLPPPTAPTLPSEPQMPKAPSTPAAGSGTEGSLMPPPPPSLPK